MTDPNAFKKRLNKAFLNPPEDASSKSLDRSGMLDKTPPNPHSALIAAQDIATQSVEDTDLTHDLHSTSPSLPLPPLFNTPPNVTPHSDRIASIAAALKFWGIALSDRQGNVKRVTGEMEAETACAITAMATQEMEKVMSLLGLGELKEWCVSEEHKSWYVLRRGPMLLMGLGEHKRNPFITLSQFAEKIKG